MARKIPIKSLKRGAVRFFLILTRGLGHACQSLRKHFTLPAQKLRLRLADAREMTTVYFYGPVQHNIKIFESFSAILSFYIRSISIFERNSQNDR